MSDTFQAIERPVLSAAERRRLIETMRSVAPAKAVKGQRALTANEMLYAQGLLAGLSDQEAREASGLPPRKQWYRKLDSDPAVVEYIRAVADSRGLNPEKIVGVLLEAMAATTIKQFQYQGQVIQAPPLVDHQTRLSAAVAAARLLQLQPKGSNSEEAPGTVNNTINVLVIGEEFAEATDDELTAAYQKVRRGIAPTPPRKIVLAGPVPPREEEVIAQAVGGAIDNFDGEILPIEDDYVEEDGAEVPDPE